jgi:hypothetical protein
MSKKIVVINQEVTRVSSQYDYDGAVKDIDSLFILLQKTKDVVIEHKSDFPNTKKVMLKIRTLSKLIKILSELRVAMLNIKVTSTMGGNHVSNIIDNYRVVKQSIFIEVNHVQDITAVAIHE